jgi:hypothetical protein
MVNALRPPELQQADLEHATDARPSFTGEPSGEVLDLALAAIDNMPNLSPDRCAQEEEEVKTLLGELDADEQRMAELYKWLRKAAGSGEMRYRTLARLMDVPQTAEQAEELSGDEVVRRLESQHYVKKAPKFADQLADESREETVFTYDGQTFSDTPESRGKRKYQTTELRGIRELSGFVEGFIRKSTRHLGKANFKLLKDSAKSIRDNLTYIGSKEMDESSSGLAQYWAKYLTEDKDNQLCIITASSLDTVQGRTRRVSKSDDFVRDTVLEQLAKAESSDKPGERIVTDPRKIGGDPAKTKIVFVDDWVVSGWQMRDKIKRTMLYIGNEYREAIEVNVLTAPTHFIKDGLAVEEDGTGVPVKAYYRAHPAAAKDSEGVKCHITGTHSTVNFGFSVQIERMQKLLNEIRGPGQRPVQMPAVASVYRGYWGS